MGVVVQRGASGILALFTSASALPGPTCRGHGLGALNYLCSSHVKIFHQLPRDGAVGQFEGQTLPHRLGAPSHFNPLAHANPLQAQLVYACMLDAHHYVLETKTHFPS